MIKKCSDFINESVTKVKVLGSIGNFQFFDDEKLGKVIILLVGKGSDQMEHSVKINPEKDTVQSLSKKYYVGKELRINI